MLGPSRQFPARIIVLSLETLTGDPDDPDGHFMLAPGSRADEPSVQLAAIAMLSFSRDVDGGLRRIRMVSIDALAAGEVQALTFADRCLGRHHWLGADLVAFGAHDALRTLSRRARRHWLFEKCDFPRWTAAGSGAVFDPAADWNASHTLAEVCSATGIEGAGAPPGREEEFDGCGPVEDFPYHVRRVEAATMATAFLHAHSQSAMERSPLPLMAAWSDLLAHVRACHPRLAHCASFRCDGMVDPDLYSVVGAPLPRRRAASSRPHRGGDAGRPRR